ncbi:amino acid ABC transporter membrane protein, PAAT family (TC 3.A.1.3.-) [Butyrivibrio fibrisolvens DSM 3071]|jgi:His/Glu/Gln/Arg/opine family amino acid ABC transporter permease subunit|uniref:Amino acid ABC transporter membrane protein, PAAT family (TC 3.A.1.3.-) n=1 Tax=Butyrivibrio fibrisolvens DSM 3071 TaxID=1121131 RepID=A0A1M6DPV6_BUTFI|nr:amino acid ABC transporter permease [Butyrivibrio fibrisolvens]SHI75276.1 amino acid ABC transporter membrane protein, PAAT family (TC 3.A.1.3.-) [Butyrivibrio fibrisolvens DSM 3071]
MGELINIAVKYRMLLLNGAKITLIVSVLTIIFGLICGILMAFMKMSKIKILKIFANIYVEFIRGTPVLVQIFLVYYGLPIMGVQVPSIVIGGVDISRIVSGTLALVINTTAYVCEIVRGGIESIDYGQTEGALALGMKPGRAMLAIVFPQAMKNILPSLGNEFITIIKTSSQISVIGIADLMYTADTIRGISFKPMEPLILVALIYFAITFIISTLLRHFEKKMKKSYAR